MIWSARTHVNATCELVLKQTWYEFYTSFIRGWREERSWQQASPAIQKWRPCPLHHIPLTSWGKLQPLRKRSAASFRTAKTLTTSLFVTVFWGNTRVLSLFEMQETCGDIPLLILHTKTSFREPWTASSLACVVWLIVNAINSCKTSRTSVECSNDLYSLTGIKSRPWKRRQPKQVRHINRKHGR